MRSYLGMAVVFAAALFRLQAEPTSLVEFPFEFREGLIWVEVRVPQKAEPLSFLLDTGAGVSVINLSTAQKLGLRLGQRVSVSGVQTTTEGFWPQHLRATAGPVSLPKDYLAVDLGKLGQACARPVDGLIGADFFRGRVVQIDFAECRIRWLKPHGYTATGEVLPLRLRPCGMCVSIRVNHGQTQWVRLDTGCASALQWVTSEVRPERCPRQIAVGLAEVSVPRVQTTVQIGSRRFEAVPTGLHAQAIFTGESGLLGNELLARFTRLTIDAKGRRMFAETDIPGN